MIEFVGIFILHGVLLCKIPNIFSKKTHCILLAMILVKKCFIYKKKLFMPSNIILYIDKFKRLILAKAVLAI